MNNPLWLNPIWLSIIAVTLVVLGHSGVSCNVGRGGSPPEPASALDQLLEAGAYYPPVFDEGDILYEYDGHWPVLPLVEGGWCRMDSMYWSHGVEDEFEKYGLVLDQEPDGQWHLWVYNYNWDLGNNPIPDKIRGHGDSWTITHCTLKEEPHVLPRLPNLPLWTRITHDRYRKHYDGQCMQETKSDVDHYETDWHAAMVGLRGLQGRVTLSIGLPSELIPKPGGGIDTSFDTFRETAIGVWEAMGVCSWPNHNPKPGYEVTTKDRDRVKKWVWSPIGWDAGLGETREQANARAREYILSDQYKKDGP